MLLHKQQKILFSRLPSFLELLKLHTPLKEKAIKINVWRNHGFETLVPLMQPYLATRNISIDFQISSYDDSFSFAEYSHASIEILWLDPKVLLSQSSSGRWVNWLSERINFLRRLSKSPIILATWAESGIDVKKITEVVDSVRYTFFADLSELCCEYSINLKDSRNMSFAASAISRFAQVIIARKLACHWISALLLPPIKAIAIDLDNTLHKGILGEDEISGVLLTDEHRALHHKIKKIQKQGIFIALISRNEYSDVKKLFSIRKEYPLRLEDFTEIEISWDEKSNAIKRIAESINISTDAIIFVDDNPGELFEVNKNLPHTHIILAHADASITERVIDYYPGLWRWNYSEDDYKRVNDFKANKDRNLFLSKSQDLNKYYSSLEIKLKIYLEPFLYLDRLSDLSNKTNQFNLALKRYSEIDLFNFLNSKDTEVFGIGLNDKLSDSGIISLLVAELIDHDLMIHEVCISCRALGRKLEDAIIFTAIKNMRIFKECKKVIFSIKYGKRNKPAISWIEKHSNEINAYAHDVHIIDAENIRNYSLPKGLKIIKT